MDEESVNGLFGADWFLLVYKHTRSNVHSDERYSMLCCKRWLWVYNGV